MTAARSDRARAAAGCWSAVLLFPATSLARCWASSAKASSQGVPYPAVRPLEPVAYPVGLPTRLVASRSDAIWRARRLGVSRLVLEPPTVLPQQTTLQEVLRQASSGGLRAVQAVSCRQADWLRPSGGIAVRAPCRARNTHTPRRQRVPTRPTRPRASCSGCSSLRSRAREILSCHSSLVLSMSGIGRKRMRSTGVSI
jgi:hypothetical protein